MGSAEDEDSVLSTAEQTEFDRIDTDGDGKISKGEARAAARRSAEMRSKLSMWKKISRVLPITVIIVLLGNFALTFVVVAITKETKIEGGSLQTKDGASVSTHNAKNVYLVKVLSRRRLDEQAANHTSEQSIAAEVACAAVMLAISSIEGGDDEGLVKISLGDGGFWAPRMSAASYSFHENSFGIEQIYLDDQRDVSYDVTCNMSKASCESAPGSVCDAVEVTSPGRALRRALTSHEAFEEGFDGDFSDLKNQRRRLAGGADNC